MTLKQKTISGLTWSFIDSVANQGLLFVIGIVLARILSPKEFGLVGMLTIFIAISQSFIDSGFGQALIRKKDCTTEDYSTVFYYNLAIGLIFYFILFFSAGAISNFFNTPQLKLLVQVLGLNLIITSVSLIQQTILTKNIDFKLQTKISIISSIVSGVIGIGMAYRGWGVWSLVWQTVSQNMCKTGLLWIWNKWKPALAFRAASFRELFGFGSKLMISGLIDTTYTNIYYLIIGKYFSAQELGYFTRARQFTMSPSQILAEVIQRVSYPALVPLQDDLARLKAAYKKLIKSTMLISFILMFGLAAIAGPLVITLIGEKWSPCIIYLQLLCFVGMFYPLHALNLNMLKVKGRSDLFLRLELIKKALVIPTIIIGVMFGIKIMIIGMIINSIIAYFLNSYWSGKLVHYPSQEQIADLAAPFMGALIVGLIVFSIKILLPFKPYIVLCVQMPLVALIFWVIVRAMKLDSYIEIKNIIKERLAKYSWGILNGNV